MLPALSLTLAIAVGTEPPCGDHAALIAALERLVQTGEPRHVDHDAGQDLQSQLTCMLANRADAPSRWLAICAAFPIVPRMTRPLSEADNPPLLELRASRVLSLPWSVAFDADIEGQIDAGEWRVLKQIHSGQVDATRLDSMFSSAELLPGLHVIRLRARLRYSRVPTDLPRQEVRDLRSVSFGLWARQGRSVAPAAFDVGPTVQAAKTAFLSQLESGMPETTLDKWLTELAHNEERASPLWRTDWCSMHATQSDELRSSNDVCLVGSTQVRGTVADVWVRIGELETAGDRAAWRIAEPTLAAAYLRRTGRTPVSLALLPALLDVPEDWWPAPIITVHGADVEVVPAIPDPLHPTEVHAFVENTGSAAAFDVVVDVIAGSEAAAGRRRFVRTIAAGDRVELVFQVQYRLPYGFVMIHAMLPNEHSVWTVPQHVGTGTPVAIHFVNPEGAPRHFVASICQTAIAVSDCAVRH